MISLLFDFQYDTRDSVKKKDSRCMLIMIGMTKLIIIRFSIYHQNQGKKKELMNK